MIRIGSLLLVVLFFVLLPSCVTTEGDLFKTVVSSDSAANSAGSGTDTPNKENPTDGEETTPDGKTPEPEKKHEPGVEIVSEPDGADVFLDREYMGKTPLLLDLKDGDYDVVIRKSGYRPESLHVSFTAGEFQSYHVVLTEKTGYLHISTNPPEAEVYIDGEEAASGVSELRVGAYLVSIRAFGFEPYELRVLVAEQETTEVYAELLPAKLEISNFTRSRRVLNPDNPGRLGEADFSFEVTTRGKGIATISNDAQRVVRTIQLERFATWNQHFTWDGTDDRGDSLPDGVYHVEISATAEDGSSVQVDPKSITLSRKAVITYRSAWCGATGMLYVPTAEILPASSFQVTTLASGSINNGRLPIQTSFRIPVLDSFEIGAQAGAILNATGTVPLSAGVSVKYDITGATDATAPFGLVTYGVATLLARTTADTQTNFSGGRIGTAATLRAGVFHMNAAVELAGAPYPVSYSPDPPQSRFSLWSYGRLGIMLDFGSVIAGVSAAVRSRPFADGFGIDLPFAAGAEVHVLVPGTHVMLSAIAFSEIESSSSYYVSYGGGVGIVH